MKLRAFSFMLSVLGSISLLLSSDSPNTFDKLLENLEKQTFDFVQEKVYLHLDQPYYSLGDDLWFKAYTVAGPNHTPSPLSQNLHVELVSPKGKVLGHRTIFLDRGLGKGDFALKDSLAAGVYLIRAYTNWMRNFDKSYFFEKQFRLINPLKKEVATAIKANTQPMRFFPEGGELVSGVASVVAVEWPAAREGSKAEVIDQDNNVVAKFTIGPEGLSKFGLLPLAGKRYFVQPAGGANRMALPDARPTGFVMAVDNQSNDTDVLIRVMSPNRAGRHLAYLVAHTRGKVGFASKLDWKGAVVTVKIPKANLSAGISHLTLFNDTWLPESERLIFKHSDKKAFQLSVSTDRDSYSSRDSTRVKLSLKNAKGEPVKGFFSMNAYDVSQMKPEAWQDNILSNLLLTSDLQGQIKNPREYLKDSPEAKARLDLLLMTKGWSRFTWKDLLNGRFPEINHEVERGFNVTGKVTQRSGKKGLAKAKVQQVGAFQGVPLFNQTTTNAKGEFEMKNSLFYAGETALKAKDRKGRDNVNLLLDSLVGPEFPEEVSITPWLELSAVTSNFTERSSQRQQLVKAFDTTGVTDLGSVVIEADEVDQTFANMQRGLVFGRGEYGVNVSDKMVNGQQFVNALFILQGNIPGVQITLAGEAGEPNVQMTRKVWSMSNPDPPISYYIDDSPVDLAAVTSLPATLVERVDVLKGMRATSIFGPSANGGAVMFYTKNREEHERFFERMAERNQVLDKSVRGLKHGYYHSREFYAPNYSVPAEDDFKPDLRDLIHWEPMIETDKNGEATVTFFNADLPARIRVQVEGLWEGGTPLVAHTEYEVRK